MFILQVLIVVVLVAAAVVALVLQARNSRMREARAQALGTAEAFSHAPGLAALLRGPDPTSKLQPLAEEIRGHGDIDFLEVTNVDGIRYTYPRPSGIGKKLQGSIETARRGHRVIESVHEPVGEVVQAVVVVKDGGDKVVGFVSAGITLGHLSSAFKRQLPVVLGAGALALALATAGTALAVRRLRRQTHGLGPEEMTRMYEHHDAVLHTVREGVVIVDETGTVLLVNDEARRLLELPPDAEGHRVDDLPLTPRMKRLILTRDPVDDEVTPTDDRLLAVNSRPTDSAGGPPGSATTLRDTTELRTLAGRAEVARSRLKLLHEASVTIGTTLDVERTADELAQAATPGFADYTTVDLAEPVLDGDEPAPAALGAAVKLRRVALRGISDDHPLYRKGELVSFAAPSPPARGFSGGSSVLVADLRTDAHWQMQDSQRAQGILDHGCHSLITVPLQARGILIGVANFWRTREGGRFEEDDLALAQELAARASICIDNARRYTREHNTAVTLQHSLLPGSVPEQNALDIAHRYLPAQAGVGGDWFDVIPLPGARVALVVGDVVGHGLHAAATMARLRTAVQNFAALDVPPDELLARLDDLVMRLDQENTAAGREPVVMGATCLYAIYDPTTGMCDLARAGHPLPALVRPDGTADFPGLPAGPPLGLGGMPFQAARLSLPEGSSLILYTDGLVQGRHRDITTGLTALRTALAHAGRTPQQTCRAVLDALPPTQDSDDITLLVVRTHRLAPDRIAHWDVPTDPATVSVARANVTRQLAEWGVPEAVSAGIELIISELVTNAIRYGTSPITMRLLYDRVLTCEVSDASSTAPHLRYAADDDEGGRGLFLVARLSERWGTRYPPNGKVIWAECSPHTTEERPPHGGPLIDVDDIPAI
ncbi:serine phosphatase RsbU (regulator of sigma subunit)/anti-sigma regulatory factor (Ser/Thr protein kinase)/PAS domain-containing protein [Streptomyces griseochromogenes]|uniref:Serine phosphatase RsbU (Regulator of sigma subunit)/anti-sigma regulatory factor (Ser/Thr protein kinase)/PAS domain-containing protein n=1 Tax=Streptomyces griseochromogenes TaxID=68214 RepID=A0ABS4LX51_9ACTN|nr:SpoIIE family protein phosphatase/ATP-binding protein [Streptomyces griseochromogenes]MBP2052013.1 serine phosphatase RsbU (regulator of sigma subunit)/anti-sigma regulatory factor (Ser/Thr protein kinase)/PAS domain-containing protein [Streptomyces griseochromogenes]